MKTIVTLSIIGVIVLLVAGLWINVTNTDARLVAQAEAVQLNNKNVYSKIWKEIPMLSKVALKDRETLKELFVAHAQARTGNGKSGSLATWIHESVPNVSSENFNNLQNKLSAALQQFAQNQTQLIDVAREIKVLRTTFPGNIFLSGRKNVDITIVTDNNTENAFASGVDDNRNVFEDPKPDSTKRNVE